MARQTIQRVITPLYDKTGKHVLDRTDEWVVDTRDGVRHMIQDPPRPTPPPVRPGGPLPPAPPPLPDAAKRPAPLQTFPCPDVGRLVAMIQAGQPLPPLTRPQPTANTMACEKCHRVTGCLCGTPSLVTLAQQLDAALKRKP